VKDLFINKELLTKNVLRENEKISLHNLEVNNIFLERDAQAYYTSDNASYACAKSYPMPCPFSV